MQRQRHGQERGPCIPEGQICFLSFAGLPLVQVGFYYGNGVLVR